MRRISLQPLYRGDDHTLRLRFRRDDGDPFDIRGWTIYATFKLHVGQSDERAALTIDRYELDGPRAEEGEVMLTLSNDDTRQLKATTYVMDVKAIGPQGSVTTLFTARQPVLDTVTQRGGN